MPKGKPSGFSGTLRGRRAGSVQGVSDALDPSKQQKAKQFRIAQIKFHDAENSTCCAAAKFLNIEN
jgi:hypothetical protein